ncbi:hypothetical protein BpHYR1_027541 [Brachionus plicatilis]|uniref:Uncharacterized protein n=1 Tax=Brachionus plicatilis TaxID=10195 RepID=A0A3M7SPF2_BRAPC|nr:hypothetical protein BpHYR1_027541 [Brachionus plicatilis]
MQPYPRSWFNFFSLFLIINFNLEVNSLNRDFRIRTNKKDDSIERVLGLKIENQYQKLRRTDQIGFRFDLGLETERAGKFESAILEPQIQQK